MEGLREPPEAGNVSPRTFPPARVTVYMTQRRRHTRNKEGGGVFLFVSDLK